MKIREVSIDNRRLTVEEDFIVMAMTYAKTVLEKGRAAKYLREKRGMIIESYDGTFADFKIVEEREATFEEERAYHYLQYCDVCKRERESKNMPMEIEASGHEYCPLECKTCASNTFRRECYEQILKGKEVIL